MDDAKVPGTETLPLRFADAARDAAAARVALGSRLHGVDAVIDDLMACVLAGGHALFEGVPGTGKTLLAGSLAGVLGLDLGRIQFTPDLMPADITGTTVMAEGRRRRGTTFRPGPVFHAVVLADEINRAVPRTQSALLEAMAERQVTVAGTSRSLPDPFVVLATQNPIDQEGTHVLPEAQVDRFMMQINVAPPSHAAIERIVEQTTGATLPPIEPVMSAARTRAIMSMVDEMLVAPHVDHWISNLVASTAEPDSCEAARLVRSPCSPRAAISLRRAACARALCDGRLAASCHDVRAVSPACLRHRLRLTPEGMAKGMDGDGLVSLLLRSVPCPADEVIR